MKKILAILLAAQMLLTITACGCKKENDRGEETLATNGENTVGAALLTDFRADATGTAQQIAERLLTNPVIGFVGGAVPVEEGMLTGFGETEITGFREGVMFAPMIGTIPFVGYIFHLAQGADVEAFKTLLKDNANLRWNICTQADELIVANEGNVVFFLMSPKSFEQSGTGDMDTTPEDGVSAADGM